MLLPILLALTAAPAMACPWCGWGGAWGMMGWGWGGWWWFGMVFGLLVMVLFLVVLVLAVVWLLKQIGVIGKGEGR